MNTTTEILDMVATEAVENYRTQAPRVKASQTPRQGANSLRDKGIISELQLTQLMTSACGVMGTDGKSYGMYFDPAKRPWLLDEPYTTS